MASQHFTRAIRAEPGDRRRRMLANHQVQFGILGEAVALVRRARHLLDSSCRGPLPAHIGRHVGKQQMLLHRVPKRPFGKGKARTKLLDRRIGIEQVIETRVDGEMGQGGTIPPVTLHREPLPLGQALYYRTRAGHT